MAQPKTDSKVSELISSKDDTLSSTQDKQLPIPMKKTPLRDLPSENNIIPQKNPSNSLLPKEPVITDTPKVSGTKRPFSETQMNPHQQSPNNTTGTNRLVYVLRKSEGEAAKTVNSDATVENGAPTKSMETAKTVNNDATAENGAHVKSVDKVSVTQSVSVIAPIPTSPTMCIPSGKPSIPAVFESLESKLVSEERGSLPVEVRVSKQNWEERYIQLQMYLKKLDQSSLEDHLQMLRSLTTPELSRHAIELEKRAIQLSLEQGKELTRVKALNVLGKSLKPSNGLPSQQTPQT